MRVQCPQCRSSLSVPDEKIPEGKSIRVLCPKCRNPIQVGRQDGQDQEGPSPEKFPHSEESAVSPAAPPSQSSAPVPGAQSPAEESTRGGMDLQSLDMAEDGVERALVCLSDRSIQSRVQHALQQMDYYVSLGSTHQQAIIKLSNNPYDMVIMDEGFQEKKEDGESVFHYISSMAMPMRRTFVLCLISEKLRTLDHLTAFRLGLDVILNVQDLEKTRMILERAANDHKKQYRAFMDELESKQ